MSLQDYPLIPAEEPVPSGAEELDAAEASVEDALAGAPAGSAPAPFGRTPLFDFDQGRFVRSGGSVVWVNGLDAVRQWCMMVVRSARYAHAVFTDEFGLEDPEAPLSEVDIEELISDYGVRLEDALLVHDRIASVDNYEAEFDPDEQVITITSLDVTTDVAEAISLQGEQIAIGTS